LSSAAGLTTLPEFTDREALGRWLTDQRAAGRRIGLVPTMGALHDGHLSLVDEARGHADLVVMSIFVNPLQFGEGEDYQRYPRALPHDRELARQRGVAALFVPTVDTMYPPGTETRVAPGPEAERWEGQIRPGHFTGVLTVVAKLFHLVQPDVAVFGQKDIQQAVLIRRMVADLNFPLVVVVAPTVRESDGLALSSRNAYLDREGRRQAVALSRSLEVADRAWRTGECEAATLERHMREEFRMFPGVTVDYIAIVDPDRLHPVKTAARGTIVAVAGRIGTTRLLDNHVLGMEFR
jgi:pantoate--beta-alanine ligase